VNINFIILHLIDVSYSTNVNGCYNKQIEIGI